MVLRKLLALILLLSFAALNAQEAETLPSELEPELKIDRPSDPEASAYTGTTIRKPEVIAVIDSLRNFGFPTPLPFNEMQSPLYPTAYRSNFDYTGLLNEPLTLHKDSYAIPASMHSPWQYLGYLSQFHNPVQEAHGVFADHHPYDLPVSLTRLQGSLGDYDSRYALGSFAKGDLIGIEGLSFQYDYSLYNGWWLDSPVSGNASRQYLAYRHKQFFWSLDYASYTKESGSYELDPAYWMLGNLRIKNRHNQFVASFGNPWLDISMAGFQERSTALSFADAYHSKSLHLAARKELWLNDATLSLRHEYRNLSRNYVPAFSINQRDYSNLSTLSLTSPYLADLDLKMSLWDWEQAEVCASLSKEIRTYRLGILSRSELGTEDPVTRITSPVNGSLMDYIAPGSARENAVYAILRFPLINLRASYGIKQQGQTLSGNRYSQDVNILRLGAELNARRGDFSLQINSSWNYQEFDPYLVAAPEFAFVSRQNIIWHLSHDNQLEAGFGIYGHSDYYLANAQNPILIEASTLVDAWVAVRISKLFDFNVSARNLFSTSLYGLYPIPLSLHAGLRWYFIN